MAVLGGVKLDKVKHSQSMSRFLTGLPHAMTEADSNRTAFSFYCLSALDILRLLDARLRPTDREDWRAWLWAQQVQRRLPVASHCRTNNCSVSSARDPGEGIYAGVERTDYGPAAAAASLQNRAGRWRDQADNDGDDYIGGFRPGPFMHIERDGDASGIDAAMNVDPPHLIMTYTALLALAILRDDFRLLDRNGLYGLLRATQLDNGSFTAIPSQGEADLRMVYTAFAICAMLDDWSAIDIPRAIAFIKRCKTYEGGFGQAPGNESQGGPTYCALAALALVPREHVALARLTPDEHRRVVRWLVHRQTGAAVGVGMGGFSGRTEKESDTCYSFWCGASLKVLGANALVDQVAHARFLVQCQSRIGGLSKSPDLPADPYHTMLGLAALAMYPPFGGDRRAAMDKEHDEGTEDLGEDGEYDEQGRIVRESWSLLGLDAVLNVTEATARWARIHVSGAGRELDR